MNRTSNNFLMSIKRSKKIINTEGSLEKNLGTQYPIIAAVAEQEGFQVGFEVFTLYWTDRSLTIK